MCAAVLLLVGWTEGVQLAQGWPSLAWPCSLIPPSGPCCRQQPCTPASAASMETDSKEAAAKDVDTLPPAAAVAASSGEEMPEISAATAETGHLPHRRSVARHHLTPLALTRSCAPLCCA